MVGTLVCTFINPSTKHPIKEEKHVFVKSVKQGVNNSQH
jgi:hypothetical protein